MKIYSNNIHSNLDSLRIKDSEMHFYENCINSLSGIGLTKVVPVNGINIDLMYIKNNNILFIKFMDTTEEIYSILEDELLEVMEEEYYTLQENLKSFNLDVKYNLIYIMPYIEIDNIENDFINNHIIDNIKYNELINDTSLLDKYLMGENDDVILNLFRFYISPEYHVIKKYDKENTKNKFFKKILFSKDEYRYNSLFLSPSQIEKINSIKYGNTLFTGPNGSSKTTILISRAIKLAKLYPKERFLFITYNKQLMHDIKNQINLLYKSPDNLDIYNYHGFIFKMAKDLNLVIDYNKLKLDFSKYFKNVFLQVKNTLKEKKIYKGIFIDGCENFNEEEIKFIHGILFKSKNIFNISVDKSQDIQNNIKSFKGFWENIAFDDIITLEYNYKQTQNISLFVNNFRSNIKKYIENFDDNLPNDYYLNTKSLRCEGEDVEIIFVDDIEEKIKSIIWEIEYLITKKGFGYSDIVIVYPYNKRKLKNGNMIYFQYILRKALEESNIPYIYANDELTNLSNKNGVTISNIYSINNLEYKSLILCQIEMLYGHHLSESSSNNEINNFIKNLNMICTALTCALDKITIVTTFKEENSDIIKMITSSL
ncbi:P-loop NTPase family protein [Tepidibacter aestuarii]|uniref:DNA helicase n=1 Tax=Tepidibacter aestuarii TaxID=2925782 RepID=UPI0020BDBCAB|nr:DNA helicase [Tepidibacter aestuarii]CAH2213656.1 DNA helicase [Tepidibacter aestuarii]CAH2215662.1 DNA helicase [Tepidibacter aestuarii]